LPYLYANFVSLDDLARACGSEPEQTRTSIEACKLPHPAYVLADGIELVPPDYFALADAAGGEDELATWFKAAYSRAAIDEPAADPVETAWVDYLSGAYFKCLRSVTPRTIVRKASLMARIEELVSDPREDEAEWVGSLRSAVDALDVLERPFAEFDRLDGPVSRDRLVSGVRERFPFWDDSSRGGLSQ